MTKLIKQIINNRKQTKQQAQGDCHCNYPNNYYGDQLCKGQRTR